jgi:arylsulfatase A-like enzyme
LIIFLSDNGFSCGHHGFWGKGNGTEPRNMYENSILVPFIASHPGRIPAGAVQSAMVSAYDVLPTLLEYLDLPLPQGRDLVGQSFAPLLRGEAATGRDSIVIYDEYGNTRMVRTEEYKYVARYPDGPDELWDLVNDPGERHNLSDDPAQRGRIRELRAMLEAWFRRYARPEVDGCAQAVNGLGQMRPVGPGHDDDSPAYYGVSE